MVHANTAETTVANNSTTGDVNPTQNGDGKTYEAPAVAENKPEVAGTPAVSTTEPAVAAKLDGETAKEVKALDKTKPVSYTHLDVYKRQMQGLLSFMLRWGKYLRL